LAYMYSKCKRSLKQWMDGLGQLSSFVSSTKLVCVFHKIFG